MEERNIKPGGKQQNIYYPKPAVIKEIKEENSQIKTFGLCFKKKEDNKKFAYRPGQFMMVSIPHCGEAPISISSTPSRPGIIHLSVRKAGRLTGAMHNLQEGETVGLRGPYGRPFPLADLKDKNLLFIAGGIGLAPLRSVINFCLDQKGDYGRKTILYGSRAPSDIAFKDDIAGWRQRPDVECLLTVDQAEPGWEGPVGVVTTLLDQVKLDCAAGVALICGPPVMIRFAMLELAQAGFSDDRIITTMERYMKCGLGLCGHCHLDHKLVCVDGPVFTMSELRELDVQEL